jgi:hypothetical protein
MSDLSGLAWRLVAVVALVAVGCGGSQMKRSAPVKIDGAVKQVVVTIDHGNVEVVASPDVQQVEIVRTSKVVPDGQGGQQALKDGVLTISAECGAVPKCKINHRVRVPLATDVTVTVKDGDVALIDVAGDVEVDVELGKVSGIGLTGAKIDVNAEGGGVDMILAAAPTSLNVTVAAGDISLRVPPGDYQCAFDKKAIPPFGVKCVVSAQRVISAATSVGRLSVFATD